MDHYRREVEIYQSSEDDEGGSKTVTQGRMKLTIPMRALYVVMIAAFGSVTVAANLAVAALTASR